MSQNDQSPACCPRCGAALPADAPDGACTRCALERALVALPEADQGGADGLLLDDIPIPSSGSVMISVPASEEAGQRIGHYKLLQKIGEGGFGVVYMAEQEKPVRRRVALKVIKLGMDTKAVIARFEAERQALALMDHPNIAKVFDAGATDTGRPYFVMELVKGIRITDYCDQNNLSTNDRLGLFMQVCHAIQHAHQKGIIHRDIKPSNILVTLHDGEPVPKVIDFGIAKATGQRLTDKTLFTAFDQFVGTPAYMSPEQAELSGLDIDTRSDIYSLGVLLYELLTGKTPFDSKRLVEAGLDEIRRIIREEEPPRPSTRLSTLAAEEQTAVAKRRHSDPPKLMNVLRGDLDWIVMKALEKVPTRKYETANGLAADLGRYLANEPVVARPPSQLYRVQKLIRRNKLLFSVVVTIAMALIIALGFSSWSLRRTNDALLKVRLAEDEKARLLKNALAAKVGETKARDRAEQRLYESLVSQARATRLARQTGYRSQVFDLLRQAQTMNVPLRDLAELRREALVCLGDFVGLNPMPLTNLPPGLGIHLNRVDTVGHMAALLLSDGSLLLLEMPSGKQAARLADGNPVKSFCFNEKGDQIVSIHTPASGSPRQQLSQAWVCTWAATGDGEWRKVDKTPLPGAFASFSTDNGPVIAVAELQSNSVALVDAKRCLLTRHKWEISRWGPPKAALSQDGRWLALVQNIYPESALFETLDLKTGHSFRRVEKPAPEFCDIAISSEGQHVARTSVAGCFLDKSDGLEHVATLGGYFFPSARFSFCPGSEMLALPLTVQHCIRLWDATSSRELGVLSLPDAPWNLSFSADGSVCVASSADRAWAYHLRMPEERLDLSGHAASVPAICFSPDGSRIASASKDRRLKVWDAVTGRVVWTGELPAQGHAIAYSPDGRLIATGYWGTTPSPFGMPNMEFGFMT